ncbi:hypothetical protein [Nocardiopsis sp. NPDC057823]|uniref:hypothetical protein n=1 Tax=Nocardiopsis sp. NPDC057823 TaxID=3346256 RepID=UPI00366EC657
MSAPAVPTRLAHRPTVGGLVVPWVSLESDRGHHLGQVSEGRRVAALRGRLCQICGEALYLDRYVLLGRASDEARGYVVEPGMHPECAAYSVKACPMLTGAMDHYRKHPVDMSGRSCPDPDCGCSFLPSPDSTVRAGRPADTFFKVLAATTTDYRLALTQDGIALAWPQQPLRVRTVATGALRAALDLITQKEN